MGLLSKNKESAGTLDKAAINSILDEGMVVTGDISFKGKARVDGRVEGNVKGEYLILSESGSVVGDVEVEVVVCQGQVDGNIKAEKLHAKNAAKIRGSLAVTDFTVDSGASLSGDVKAHSQDLRLVEGAAQATNFNTETLLKSAEK